MFRISAIGAALLMAFPVSPSMAATNATAAAMLERMSNADANRDGDVTRQEMLNFRASSFARLDRNADNVLTRGDIPAMAARFNPDIDFNRLIAQFDRNGDNRISRDEFINGPTVYFDQADRNRDGVVTRAEREAALAAARRR